MIEVEDAFLKELDWLPERQALKDCREVLESICEKLIGFESKAKPDIGISAKERLGE
jgi:hypothetical protein